MHNIVITQKIKKGRSIMKKKKKKKKKKKRKAAGYAQNC